MRKAIRKLSVPSELARRTMDFHNFCFINYNKTAYDALTRGIGLSASLSAEFRIFLHSHLIVSTPFFENVSGEFILAVVTALEDEVFMPGDFVVRMGDIGTQMFFIVKGRATVLDMNREPIMAYGTGDFFGEIAVLTDDSARRAWVVAETFCIVSSLEKSRLENILQDFPEQREKLMQRVRNLLAESATRASPEGRFSLNISRRSRSSETSPESPEEERSPAASTEAKHLQKQCGFSSRLKNAFVGGLSQSTGGTRSWESSTGRGGTNACNIFYDLIVLLRP